MHLYVSYYHLEANSDTISYQDLYGIRHNLKDNNNITFESFQNDSNRHVKFLFESDGSVQGSFFKLNFDLVCKFL